MKKTGKRKRVVELSTDTLSALDQEALIGVVMKLYEQNMQLSEQLRLLIQDKYGRKTERFEDQGQMRLPLSNQSSLSEHQEDSKNNDNPKAEKKPGHTRNPMPSHLNRKPVKREPQENEISCSCGCRRIKVNEVTRNTRYECLPASLYIEEIIDSVWECPNCHQSVVVKADVSEPIPGGTAGPGLLSKIAVNKFLDHLPLYRQEQMFYREGINISRSTMCGWIASIADICKPVYERLKQDLLKSKIISTDDTPVKVQDHSIKNNIRIARVWIFLGDKNYPANLFHYTKGRERDGPKKFLNGFKGYIQGDCFSGNLALCAETGSTMVACRAHERRYFVKARSNDKKSCDQALSVYRDLFEIEETARKLELSAEDVYKMRQQEAVPILNNLKTWLDDQSLTALPKSSFGKAVNYSLRNWNELNNYLLDGDLRIDNNLSEQQMKLIATGKKNWNFYGSDNGGKNASIILSLLSTCRRHDVEPIAYLRDVLEQLTADPNTNVDKLLPYNWSPRSTELNPLAQYVNS
jgi:transposase